MFACTVAVGAYCQGRSGQIVPDERFSSELVYDTTVNDVVTPKMYVTYHDGQAYPEYIVTFRSSHI